MEEEAKRNIPGLKDHGRKGTEQQRAQIEETNKKVQKEVERLAIERYDCPEPKKSLTLLYTEGSNTLSLDSKKYSKEVLKRNGISGGNIVFYRIFGRKAV